MITVNLIQYKKESINNGYIYLRLSLGKEGKLLFPSNKICVSYSGLYLKIREARFSDIKSQSISKQNQVIISNVDDYYNWIGEFELVADGEWYILERI